MKKVLLSTFIAVFSFFQVNYFFHNLKYDFKHHTHNSQACQIYISYQKAKDSLGHFSTINLAVNFEFQKPKTQIHQLFSQIHYFFSFARSPPLFLI